MRPHQRQSRGVARILVDILARTSIDRDPPGFPDQSSMLPVVDPQVPEGDRELLRHADPAHLAHARTHTLRQLRRSRLHTSPQIHLYEHCQERAAKALTWVAKGAALGTLVPLAMAVLPVLIIGEMMPPGILLILAALGWGAAALSWWDFVQWTGLRWRPRVEPTAAAAHRNPGRFILPEDLGEEGRALVARADRLVDNAAVHEQIPDQLPVYWEHLWRLAENAAVHEQALGELTDKQALDEYVAAMTAHVDRLRARIERDLARAPAAVEAMEEDDAQAGAETARELRARIAGTRASINELTEPDEREP